MTEAIKILYISPDKDSLNHFRNQFNEKYKVFTATNASDAFSHLKKHPDILIIICAEVLPDKNGIVFFEEIADQNPGALRLLIASSTGGDFVINAFNRAKLFKIIKQPCSLNDIIEAATEAIVFCSALAHLLPQYKELQKGYDELDKFAYSVTHDVRRPLLSILGAVEVAQSLNDIAEVREMLKMMEESVRSMDDFIHNIHQYYKLRHLKFQYEEIDFNEIINNQKEIFHLATEMNNIEFRSFVKQNAVFKSDKMALTLILNNLLSNAIKYQRRNNAEKFVEATINVEEGSVFISIKDNGIGIPKQHLPEIFNMFFRANSEEVGSGVGLYNVKDALLKLNGLIEVESKPNYGTTFTVTIPGK